LTSVPRHDVGHDRKTERRCPDCGARNASGAEWCGQCLRPFTHTPDAAGAVRRGPERPAQAGASAALPDPEASSPFEVDGGVVTWTCRICDARNPLDAPACCVCGAELAALLRPPPRRGPQRDPATTALLSLFMPGAGHAYVGLWGQAAARAVTSIWVISVALMFALAQGPAAPIPLLFEALAFGLWTIAAHDAYREAAGDGGSVFLRGRTFMFVFLGLVALSVVAVFVSAFAALGSQG
jgi:hypothetical protein